MESHPYSPLHIANTFIFLSAKSENKDLTPLKLIKLVYIFYAWYLATYDKPPFEEKPQAWKYGPVFPGLYQEFGRYKKENLTLRHLAIKYDLDDPDDDQVPVLEDDKEKDDIPLRIVSAIWSFYKDKSGTDLSKITHNTGSAWDDAWRSKNDAESTPFLDEEKIKEGGNKGIQKYFARKV